MIINNLICLFSKLFRRSTVLQSNGPNFNSNETKRSTMTNMNVHRPFGVPMMDLDKLAVSCGSPPPPNSIKAHSNRLPRSRSGVTPHRSSAGVKTDDFGMGENANHIHQNSKRSSTTFDSTTLGRSRALNSTDFGLSNTLRRSVTNHGPSNQRDSRSHSVQRSSSRHTRQRSYYNQENHQFHDENERFGEPNNNNYYTNHLDAKNDYNSTNRRPSSPRSRFNYSRRPKSPSPCENLGMNESFSSFYHNSSKNPSMDSTSLGRTRSIRFVLRSSGQCASRHQLDEIMNDIKQVLIKNHIDFEVINVRKLQCVYGDPSAGSNLITSTTTTSTNHPDSTPSLVHWEMEICTLPWAGTNGLRLKRLSGPFSEFKNIANKLASDFGIYDP